MSILGPILIALLMFVPAWLADQSGENKVIEVIDESGMFKNKFTDTEKLQFVYLDMALVDAKNNLKKGKNDGLLYIPKLDIDKPEGIHLFSEDNPSVTTKSAIERSIKKEIEDLKLIRLGIEKSSLDSVKTKIAIKTINLSETGEKTSNTTAASLIGYISGFLIYFFIFLYGTQIMRGVIEEKSNRIVEVIISSVKPFELMLGKIVGVGGVAFTQFLLWVVLSFGISSAVGAFVNIDKYTQQKEMINMGTKQEMPEIGQINEVFEALNTLNVPLLTFCFAFYFLGGYLLYGAFFGAIGAASESDEDAQQFILPVTLPLILTITMAPAVINDPSGTIAFWLSMIPLTSPIVMMIRLPFIGFGWELMLSMSLLVFAFLGATWLAAKIYRVGILMYGKKVSYKELMKWLFY